jgi:hypothetical protein
MSDADVFMAAIERRLDAELANAGCSSARDKRDLIEEMLLAQQRTNGSVMSPLMRAALEVLWMKATQDTVLEILGK